MASMPAPRSSITAFAPPRLRSRTSRRRHHRRPAEALDQHERGQQHGPGRERGEGARVAPAVGVAAGEREDERADAQGRGDRARHVEGAALGVARDEHAGADQHQDRDGDVDEQHPAPAQVLGERAAEQQSHHRAKPAHRAVDAERPGPGRPGREGGGKQRQRAGRGDRRTSPLHDTSDDQHRPVRGKSAGHRGQREHADPDPEHPQAAEQVAGPPPASSRPPKASA